MEHLLLPAVCWKYSGIPTAPRGVQIGEKLMDKTFSDRSKGCEDNRTRQ